MQKAKTLLKYKQASGKQILPGGLKIERRINSKLYS
jgi:hypothetical protein